MDINDLRGLSTAFLMMSFIGLCFWAYSKKRKRAFDEAANLPFADDELNQRTVQEEVERAEVGKLVSNDVTRDHAAKVRCHPVRRHFSFDHRVVLGTPGDHADVGRVTLVAASSVRERERNEFPSISVMRSTRFHTAAGWKVGTRWRFHHG